LDTRREVVSLWRKRLFADRLAGLEEHARPGRPRTFFPQISSFRLRPWDSVIPLEHGWYRRNWTFPCDPGFATKAGRVPDLYARQWQSSALREDEFVDLSR
jgi:hypothetical protein